MTYYEKIFPKNIEMYLFCKKEDKIKFDLKRTKIVTHNSGKFSLNKILRKFCKDNNIDVLTNLSRREKVAMLMIYSTIFTKTKSLFYDHGNPRAKNIFVLALLQFFLDRIIVTTTDIERKLKKYLFFSKKKIFWVSPSVNTEFFTPLNKKKTREKLGIKSNEEVISFSGRVSYLKGSDFLMEAVRRNPKRKFILAGDILDEDFKDNLPKNLTLTGPVSPRKLQEIYSASDLFLFPSRTEGAGLTPREAMSCKCPAIISNIESLRTLDVASKFSLDSNDIQKEIDNFFKKTRAQRINLSNKSRDYIVNNLSDDSLKKVHLENFLEF